MADVEAQGEGFEDASELDLLFTLLMLRKEFPSKLRVCRFVVRTHIYSVLKNKTAVDRELEALICSRKVCMIKLASGSSDYGIVLLEDYLSVLEDCKRRVSKERGSVEEQVLDWFGSTLSQISSHCYIDDYVIKRELREYLKSISEQEDQYDNHITMLIQSGLLTRRLSEQGGYWFSLPNLGLFTKHFVQGRKALIQVLKRRKRNEILQWDLEKYKLQRTSLSAKFLIRDAIGSGTLEQAQTTCGPLLRLITNKDLS